MVYNDMQKVDRPTWHRYLFYVDLAVFAIFAISIILGARHAFMSGMAKQGAQFDLSIELMWLVVADVVFLVASLCWILYRFFRSQYVVMTRRF
jgi:hypothetical protein